MSLLRSHLKVVSGKNKVCMRVIDLGFGSYIGGIILGILAVIIAFLGIIVMLGFVKLIPAGYDIPLGIIMIIMALFLFAYGWYSYQSSKPKGTINVHNQ